MGISVQLCGLLLYALCAFAASQSQERVWHSTTPPVLITTTTISSDDETTTADSVQESTTTVSAEETITADSAEKTITTEPSPPSTTLTPAPVPENVTLPSEEEVPAAPQVTPEESVVDAISPEESSKLEFDEVSKLIPDILSVDVAVKEEKATDANKSKPRKWMSVPEEVAPPLTEEVVTPLPEEIASPLPEEIALPLPEEIAPPLPEEIVPLLPEAPSVLEEGIPANISPEAETEEVDKYSLNEKDFELPKNISDLLEAAEEGTPVVQETIISKKTTVYVTITESLGDYDPLFVNLTGIRDFTGNERRIVSGCLDLSDLMITGEEAKEILQRMAKHKFHRLDLSNNNINEFPSNTFSPVAFTVKELRLDGNPLMSNCHAEGGMLERGGLFHLTELRELNLSNCGLRDIDFFTPWNSNRLEVVDLSANNLRAVPTNLQFFHKLKKLFLDGNPITEVSELPFALLWNMQVLSFSGCYVTSITSDPFRNMEHLKELSLEGNNLTRISDVRLPRGSSGVKMYLSGNPWHCACDMLTFIEYHHYAIRDLEDIRCATPRWLEGLRTAYLTKEILSLDSVDGDCTPPPREAPAAPVAHHYAAVSTDRLEVLSLAVFGLAAVFMLVHLLWAKRKDKFKFEDDRHDINYIRIDRKPSFK